MLKLDASLPPAFPNAPNAGVLYFSDWVSSYVTDVLQIMYVYCGSASNFCGIKPSAIFIAPSISFLLKRKSP